MKMEGSVLPRIERARALWVWAGENLATNRFREVLFLDARLPRGFVEEPLQPQGRRKVLVAETPEAEARRSESIGVDEGVALIGESVEI